MQLARGITTVSHFNPSQIFVGKAGAHQSGDTLGKSTKDKLLPLQANIRAGSTFLFSDRNKISSYTFLAVSSVDHSPMNFYLPLKISFFPLFKIRIQT